MNEEMIKMLETKLPNIVDSVMENRLKAVVGEIEANATKKIVEQLRAEKAVFGYDRTGLSDGQKTAFVEVIKAAAFGGQINTKANEALIEEQDSRGGYLVSREVANAILRIAASVGVVLSQATHWPMATDELGIPNYTGNFLEGEYLGVDAAGSVSALGFGEAKLVVKKWQLAFVLGNDLLADSNIDIANWLLALGGEAMANMIDKQAFIGTAPFVGLMNDSNVAVYTLATTKTGFDKFDVIADASDVIAQLEESVLDGAAFYMHRTVWSKLRAQKDSAGNFILPFGGIATPAVLQSNPTGGGVKPAGEILGFPVFTVRHLPAFSTSAISKNFMVFGNLKCMAFGDKGEMRIAQFESGAFGGKEIALADQRGVVYKNRHALVNALAGAFVIVKTSAS